MCVAPTPLPVKDIHNVDLTDVSHGMELVGMEQAMTTSIEGEAVRSIDESVMTREQLSSKIGGINSELKKLSSAVASLVQASGSADKHIEDIQVKHKNLQYSTVYLEGKVNMFYEEVRKHGKDDETIMLEHLGTSTAHIEKTDDVMQIQKTLDVLMVRVRNMERQMAKQASHIDLLVSKLGKENVNVNVQGEETADMAVEGMDATGTATSTMKVYNRKKSQRVLQERTVDVAPNRIAQTGPHVAD